MSVWRFVALAAEAHDPDPFPPSARLPPRLGVIALLDDVQVRAGDVSDVIEHASTEWPSTSGGEGHSLLLQALCSFSQFGAQPSDLAADWTEGGRRAGAA